MKKYKILFMAHSHKIHAQRWVNYFIESGWDVYLITFHSAIIPGAQCFNLSTGQIKETGNNYKYILSLPQIRRLVKRIKPDIINSHFLSSFGLLAHLTFYGNHIINLYGTDILINARKNSIRKYLYRKVLNKAVHVFSVSDKMTDILKSDFNQSIEKVTTIQYGVNTEKFKIFNPLIKREYDFITNRSFIDNSNYQFMIFVFGIVRKAFPNFTMLIIGSGPLKPDIQKWITKYELSENIILKNSVSENEMPKYLNKSHFFLSFTKSDGTPLSIFEAIACGCYPILSDIESNKEWLGKGIQGEVIYLNSIKSTVRKIINLYRNKPENDFQQKNLDFVDKFMNYKKNMKTIEDIMRKMIKESK